MAEPERSLAERIADVAAHSKFPSEAYLFVLDAFQASAQQALLLTSARSAPPVTAEQVCRRVCAIAKLEFGADAAWQLRQWKIVDTQDVGEIIARLVAADLMQLAEHKSAEDYRGLFDLETALQPREATSSARRRLQIRLSTMLIITTLCAMIVAGYARLELLGSVAAVYLAWLITIAVACLWLSIRDRTAGYLLSALFGSLMLGAAAVTYYLVFVAPTSNL